jgi:hypothetical protein
VDDAGARLLRRARAAAHDARSGALSIWGALRELVESTPHGEERREVEAVKDEAWEALRRFERLIDSLDRLEAQGGKPCSS